MLKSLRQYNLFIVLGLFCLIFNPPVFRFNSMHLVGLLSLAYLGVHYGMLGGYLKQRRCVNMIVFFGVLFIYLLLVGLISEKGSIATAFLPAYFLLDVIPFGIAISVYQKKHDLQSADFLNVVLFVAVLQALLAVMAYFVPNVHDFFVSRFIEYGYGELYEALSKHRIYGLAGGLTYSTPILLSFLAIVAVVKAREGGYRYLLVAVLLTFAAAINARTVMVVIMVGFFAMVFFSRVSFGKKVRWTVTVGLAGVVVAAVAFPVLETTSSKNFEWLVKGIEQIAAFLRGDVEGYFSYMMNPEKYVLPENMWSFLFGTGTSIMNGLTQFGLQSDVGYINDIWRGGVVYTVALYTYVAICFIRLYKNDDEIISFVGIFALIAYPILNIKGPICHMNDMTVFMLLFYLIVVLTPPQKKEEGCGK